MTRVKQKRALETRATLLATATALVEQHGYHALRVEQVVADAGVAKGTFFKHFGDKDGLMQVLIADQLSGELGRLAELTPEPVSPAEFVEALSSLHDMMTRERYVFDIVIRYSGAAAVDTIGPLAVVFGKYLDVVGQWVVAGQVRPDLTPTLVAEGVQAFAVQAMALEYCALHTSMGRNARLTEYLTAWLKPGQ